MIFRQLDAGGDWTFGKGAASYATGQAAVSLNLATLIRSWVGDCFFALGSGINYKQFIQTPGQQKQLDAALQALILSAYGVTAVTAATARFDPRTRRFTASWTIDTVYTQGYSGQVSVLAGT